MLIMHRTIRIPVGIITFPAGLIGGGVLRRNTDEILALYRSDCAHVLRFQSPSLLYLWFGARLSDLLWFMCVSVYID